MIIIIIKTNNVYNSITSSSPHFNGPPLKIELIVDFGLQLDIVDK